MLIWCCIKFSSRCSPKRERVTFVVIRVKFSLLINFGWVIEWNLVTLMFTVRERYWNKNFVSIFIPNSIQFKCMLYVDQQLHSSDISHRRSLKTSPIINSHSTILVVQSGAQTIQEIVVNQRIYFLKSSVQTVLTSSLASHFNATWIVRTW